MQHHLKTRWLEYLRYCTKPLSRAGALPPGNRSCSIMGEGKHNYHLSSLICTLIVNKSLCGLYGRGVSRLGLGLDFTNILLFFFQPSFNWCACLLLPVLKSCLQPGASSPCRLLYDRQRNNNDWQRTSCRILRKYCNHEGGRS